MSITQMNFVDLARAYCERQYSTPQKLLDSLRSQKGLYQLTGWFVAECHVLDSSRMGSWVLIPYGPNNSFKAIADQPFSPRGLASDLSVAVAFLLAADLPEELPASLKDWQEPPESAGKRKRA